MIEFGHCEGGKPMPLDLAFDYDIDMAMLLQSDLLEPSFTLDIPQDFPISHVPIAPAPLS